MRTRLRSAALVRILAPGIYCGRHGTPELPSRACPVLYATLRALGSAMPAQRTPTEYHHIDPIVRGKKRKATDALVETNRARMRRGVELISLSAVSHYCVGLTHRRDTDIARGRPAALTRAPIRAVPRWRPSDADQAPIRHPSDSYQTPIRLPSDSHQTPIIYSKNAPAIKESCSMNLL